MNDLLTNPQLIGALGLLLFIGVIFWRALVAVEKVSGTRFKADQNARHDHFQLIERLLEKREAGQPLKTAQMHASERMRQIELDASVDKKALQNTTKKNDRPEFSTFGSEEEAMHE